MKVIIAVSRDIISYEEVCKAVSKTNLPISTVITWVTPNVVTLGERWAVENGVPVLKFEAERQKFGKRAGFLRASYMAQEADALIAVWNGKSRGVRYLINAALDYQTNVYTHLVQGEANE